MMSDKEVVSFTNAFADGDDSNTIVGGILTLAFIIALETAGTKIFMKSRERSMKVMFRREIYSRLNSVGGFRDLLTGNDLRDGELDRSKFERKKIYPRRLIVPLLCRLVLLVTEVAVIAYSGQTLVPEGNGTMSDYTLKPSAVPISEEEKTKMKQSYFCRDHLDEKRHVTTSGSLSTCVRINSDKQELSAYASGSNSILFDIVPRIDCINNEVRFTVGCAAATALRRLYVDVTYSSYDEFTQTLLPFNDGFEGSCEEGLPLETLNHIYDELAVEFNVAKEQGDNRNFQGGWTSEPNLPGIYEAQKAQIQIEGDGSDLFKEGHNVTVAMANIILTKFKLEKSDNFLLYGYDRRSGVYSNEQGGGPRLYQKNTIDQWIWLVGTIALAVIAFIFDKINKEDPEYYLFRAFMAVNSMDPIAGPLAQELDKDNDIYYFGRFKNEEGMFSSVFRNVNFGLSNWVNLKSGGAPKEDKEKRKFVSTPLSTPSPGAKKDEEKGFFETYLYPVSSTEKDEGTGFSISWPLSFSSSGGSPKK